MEDFLDYILFFVLIFFVAFTGLLLFLLVKNPTAGYLLIGLFFIGLLGITGIIGWKFVQKKRLGEFYDYLQEISHAQKEIQRSTKQLERPVRKIITEQFPQVHQLYRETHRCIKKIAEIDTVILSCEKNYRADQLQRPGYNIESSQDDVKITDSIRRYQENLTAIKLSKERYIRQVHQVLRLFQELNSQILAMKYS